MDACERFAMSKWQEATGTGVVSGERLWLHAVEKWGCHEVGVVESAHSAQGEILVTGVN